MGEILQFIGTIVWLNIDDQMLPLSTGYLFTNPLIVQNIFSKYFVDAIKAVLWKFLEMWYELDILTLPLTLPIATAIELFLIMLLQVMWRSNWGLDVLNCLIW